MVEKKNILNEGESARPDRNRAIQEIENFKEKVENACSDIRVFYITEDYTNLTFDFVKIEIFSIFSKDIPFDVIEEAKKFKQVLLYAIQPKEKKIILKGLIPK
ncbi:MAG: hypothetical protein OH319_05180 [Candidatus Parvarchaeota archaeon]|nr:hypothetical protein [Candidatus Jingweiarchaeum tengchongense]